MVHVINLDFI